MGPTPSSYNNCIHYLLVWYQNGYQNFDLGPQHELASQSWPLKGALLCRSYTSRGWSKVAENYSKWSQRFGLDIGDN